MLVDEILYTIDSDTRPYWEATKDNKLLIQYCPSCESYQFYPRVICKNCLADVEWVTSKGKGTVYSYSIVHKVFNPEFKEKVPFAIALVELEEGPRMMTNIIDIPFEEIKIGMPVEVVFTAPIGEYKLVQFKPA